MDVAITVSLFIGWILGFLSYWAVRTGIHALREVVNEEKDIKKPLAAPGSE